MKKPAEAGFFIEFKQYYILICTPKVYRRSL